MEYSIWLIVGVGAVAFAIGYMTGGSKSPVLGGVLTGVFALVTLASGVITGSDLGKKIDEIKTTMGTSSTGIQNKIGELNELAKGASGPSAPDLKKKSDEIKAAFDTTSAVNISLQTKLDSIKADMENTPLYVGATLLVFAICFMSGSFVGTKARADEWFRPKRTLPWSDEASAPAKTTEAITWLALQEKLLGFGYTKSQIQGLYRKWKAASTPDKESEIIQALAQLSGQSIDVPPYNLM